MSEIGDRLVGVLVFPRNPLNIGAAARGHEQLRVSAASPDGSHDVRFREANPALRLLALLKNAVEYSTLAEAIADCAPVVGTTAAKVLKAVLGARNGY